MSEWEARQTRWPGSPLKRSSYSRNAKVLDFVFCVLAINYSLLTINCSYSHSSP